MKLAFVDQPWAPVLPPVRSGSISIWTWEVARRLARDHQVTVYEGSRTAPQQPVVRCEDVDYRLFSIEPDQRLLRVYEHISTSKDIRRQVAARNLFYLPYAIRVALDIRRRGADIVHIHQCSQFAPVIRAINPSTRIVLHMNCEWLTQFDPALIRPRLLAADLLLGCSNHITDLIRQHFPELSSRCHTVPNGVDTDTFVPEVSTETPQNGVRTLAFVGRVSPEKGVHTLLESFSKVARHRNDVRLQLIGPVSSLPADWIVSLSSDPLVRELKEFYSGEYEFHLLRRIDHTVHDQVHFLGSVRNNELVERYQKIDILVNPSLSESFGMTVAEAMACGKAVIVTDVGGMKETVQHGVNGLRVPPADAGALADAISLLLDNRELTASMGAMGRKRAVDLYSWSRVAEAWLGCCEPLLLSTATQSARTTT